VVEVFVTDPNRLPVPPAGVGRTRRNGPGLPVVRTGRRFVTAAQRGSPPLQRWV